MSHDKVGTKLRYSSRKAVRARLRAAGLIKAEPAWGPDDCGASCGICDVCRFDQE